MIEKSKSMLNKAVEAENLRFQEGDIREIKLKINMTVSSHFHVMSYQITNESLISVFRTAFNNLKRWDCHLIFGCACCNHQNQE